MRPPSASHAAVEKARRLRFPEGAAHAAHANPPPQLRSAWGAYTNQRVRPRATHESSNGDEPAAHTDAFDADAAAVGDGRVPAERVEDDDRFFLTAQNK